METCERPEIMKLTCVLVTNCCKTATSSATRMPEVFEVPGHRPRRMRCDSQSQGPVMDVGCAVSAENAPEGSPSAFHGTCRHLGGVLQSAS